MRLSLRRPPDPRCPACDRTVGGRHDRTCRLLGLGGGRRHPSEYVTTRDTITFGCGCSDLLVRQHGAWGHRTDHAEPDYRRPALFTREELCSYAALVMAAIGAAYYATTLPAGSADSRSISLLAGCIIGPTVILILTRYVTRPREWHGRKAFEGGEPGRYVTCRTCDGDGILFAEAYPALPGPAPTTEPTSR